MLKIEFQIFCINQIAFKQTNFFHNFLTNTMSVCDGKDLKIIDMSDIFTNTNKKQNFKTHRSHPSSIHLHTVCYLFILNMGISPWFAINSDGIFL